MMNIVKTILLLSIARSVTPRRHLKSSSGESIENLLYYQDCKHSTTTTTTESLELRQLRLKQEMPQPSCPFPKMCCAMSCNNEPCVSEQLNGYGNQLHPNLEPTRMQRPFAARPAVLRARKKKMKPPVIPLGGGGGRRGFGFTKDDIKSLISSDNDIRKILKDLVRVTMQKVDLQEMIKSRRSEIGTSTVATTKRESPEYEYGDDDL